MKYYKVDFKSESGKVVTMYLQLSKHIVKQSKRKYKELTEAQYKKLVSKKAR